MTNQFGVMRLAKSEFPLDGYALYAKGLADKDEWYTSEQEAKVEAEHLNNLFGDRFIYSVEKVA